MSCVATAIQPKVGFFSLARFVSTLNVWCHFPAVMVLVAVRQSRRGAVVPDAEGAALPSDHCSHVLAVAGTSRGDSLRYLHQHVFS